MLQKVTKVLTTLTDEINRDQRKMGFAPVTSAVFLIAKSFR
jgi:hypothetical protein